MPRCFVCIDGVQHIHRTSVLVVGLLWVCQSTNSVDNGPLLCSCNSVAMYTVVLDVEYSPEVRRLHTFEFHHPTVSDATMRMGDNRFPDTMALCGHLLAIVDKSYSFLFIKLQKIHSTWKILSCVRMACVHCVHEWWFFSPFCIVKFGRKKLVELPPETNKLNI